MTPEPFKASAEHQGRPCPYCRFTLDEGVEISVCPQCAAAHHADCWLENGGCAVLGCAAAPDSTGGAETVDLGASPPTPASPPQPVAPVPVGGLIAGGPGLPSSKGSQVFRDEDSRAQNNKPLIYAILFLAVALSGAAIALAVNSGGDTAPSSVATYTPDNSIPSPRAHPNTTPELDDATARADAIQQVIRDHHIAVANGDYAGAWGLLSARKQAQYTERDGYSGWVTNQKSLTPYLSPSGLTITVQRYDPRTQVARIDVEGMGWSKPDATCSYWSGITWAKYEDGAWKYDPGYSTTAERRSSWSNRVSELLGGTCEG